MGTEIQKTNSNNVVTPLISPNLSVFLNENNELSVMDADRDVKPVSDFVSGSSGTSGQNGNSGSSGTSGQNGAGLGGTNYIVVAANGTDTENAAELQAAYNTAKTMSPSATNRITIVAANGYYNFGSSAFVMDTQYIDLVSLDGNRSIIFNSANTAGTISITANDVFVKGVDVGTKNFTIATGLNLLKVENCKGGDYSFSGEETQVNLMTISGTFINCVGGDRSFGFNSQIISGTFTNCTAGAHSFGSLTASGTFTNCVGGNYSFRMGGFFGGGTLSGVFTNCTVGVDSFELSYGTASGTFTDCKGFGNFFHGIELTLSGVFTNCTTDGSFGYGTASGTFTNCTGGGFSFGSVASGTFTNCVGGYASFGNVASGTFTNCVGGNSSFGYGGVSGTFTNCTGGSDSFGGNGTLSGKLYYCRLTSGNFQTVSGGGITRLCIDGNNNENNQG